MKEITKLGLKLQKKVKNMSKKEKDKFFKEMFKESNASTKIHNAKFYMNPEKHFPLNDECSELYLRWFNERFAYLKMEKYMPIFDKALKLLTERGNFSRRNAFGEMHCDGYLWVEKCKNIEVIIEERQSFKVAYIKSRNAFHIRELAFKYNWNPGKLRLCTLKKLKEQKFKPICDYKTSSPGFLYGDARDEGYVLSMELDWPPQTSGLIKLKKGVDSVIPRTLSAIESLKYWEVYLDDPSQLE